MTAVILPKRKVVKPGPRSGPEKKKKERAIHRLPTREKRKKGAKSRIGKDKNN